MQLYFGPLAGSLATRIALIELGIEATYTEVDPITKQTMDGDDFKSIAHLGLVPVLRIETGELLTENIAILEYLVDLTGKLGPTGDEERRHLRSWLAFIGTDIHHRLFGPWFDPNAPREARIHALQRGASRLEFLNQHLAEREFLLSEFTVADAYLITALNWAQATPVDLTQYPALNGYQSRGLKRPSVTKAIAIELPLYLGERARAGLPIHSAAE